ncbi:MAG TPA: hypothetical protein VK993_11785 [Chthoniobacterales bacterium]|nr:hypothetical protein [Chthoniobacterales bacterium]
MLLRSPSFAIISFLALALGFGVATTIFGNVNNILLKSLREGMGIAAMGLTVGLLAGFYCHAASRLCSTV